MCFRWIPDRRTRSGLRLEKIQAFTGRIRDLKRLFVIYWILIPVFGSVAIGPLSESVELFGYEIPRRVVLNVFPMAVLAISFNLVIRSIQIRRVLETDGDISIKFIDPILSIGPGKLWRFFIVFIPIIAPLAISLLYSKSDTIGTALFCVISLGASIETFRELNLVSFINGYRLTAKSSSPSSIEGWSELRYGLSGDSMKVVLALAKSSVGGNISGLEERVVFTLSHWWYCLWLFKNMPSSAGRVYLEERERLMSIRKRDMSSA